MPDLRDSPTIPIAVGAAVGVLVIACISALYYQQWACLIAPMVGIGLAIIVGLLLAAWGRVGEGRMTPPGECMQCGYDRRGLPPAAPCPECGYPVAGDPSRSGKSTR